ncbi:PTS sugar transporter subunit IIA [Erwinia sp. 198]|uniref:PTS sugar transporter subunit IIA n=1 Tax=Erwinia sp. 198 TaxID=2022746 RepID=UPI000F66A922|nr:PTS sugar transporter subunit IIA [Erwinia sp. 198]RRZ90851.1 PTS sugar transporter subunit IIA [Erwinia sp. 198]
MLALSQDDLFLDCRASSKTEAIRQAAAALEQGGYVKHGFFDAMLARESSVSTYLGAGIALPHCAKERIDLVIKTGFQVFQFPQGVNWGKGKIAFIVVAVAAKQNEHIQVIADIADLFSNEWKSTLLAQTTSKNDFITLFVKPEF